MSNGALARFLPFEEDERYCKHVVPEKINMRREPDGGRRSRRRTRTPDRARSRTRRDPGARDASSADPPREIDQPDVQRLGPYERQYDIVRGYGIERTVVRP